MAAEPIRPAAACRTPRRAARAALVLALAAPAAAAAQSSAAPGADHIKGAPTPAWQDGGVRRPLVVEPGWRADFSGAVSGAATVLRPSAGMLKDVSPALQSPVFRDEGGRLRALPGGVVVLLREPLDEQAATALLASHGARVVRRLGDRLWLVASAAGTASLEQANRLAETGAFAAAQPNWWVERPRK